MRRGKKKGELNRAVQQRTKIEKRTRIEEGRAAERGGDVRGRWALDVHAGPSEQGFESVRANVNLLMFLCRNLLWSTF